MHMEPWNSIEWSGIVCALGCTNPDRCIHVCIHDDTYMHIHYIHTYTHTHCTLFNMVYQGKSGGGNEVNRKVFNSK